MSRKNNKDKAKNRQGNASAKHYATIVAQRLRRIPKKVWWAMAFLVAVAYSWVFYSYFVEPSGFRWRALYGDPKYPDTDGLHGCDISHHQGVIDWSRLRNAMVNRKPVQFVMIKATEGSDYVDERFDENFREAKRVGLIRGAYHFWSVLSDAREQASFFLNNVKLEIGDLPPVLDVESKLDAMSTEDFQREILTWLHIVEDKYHAKPIIYTYYKFKEAYLSDERFDDYPYWIAHYYVDEVKYKGKLLLWLIVLIFWGDTVVGYSVAHTFLHGAKVDLIVGADTVIIEGENALLVVEQFLVASLIGTSHRNSCLIIDIKL